MALTLRRAINGRYWEGVLGTVLPLALSLFSFTSPSFAQADQPQGPLAELLREAGQNNPQIQAARHDWEAAQKVPTQVATPPDPQAIVQQFSVGSPRPFAGYTNSDFAYVGFGFSQDLPYPGKLRLRGQIAKKDADVLQQRVETVEREVFAGLETAYFQLAYLAEKGRIFASDKDLLQQIEQSAEARYRSGMGTQQEVLQAQLEQTKLLRDITTNDLEIDKLQATLKQLLNRSQSSADVAPAALSERPLAYTYEQLLDVAKADNPRLAGMQKVVERQQLQVDLAKRDFYPDFNVQYMWQRTDPTQFRAYYLLTFGARIPIYRKRRQEPELEQARAGQSRAQSEYDSASQQLAYDLRRQFAEASRLADLLKIYRDGLEPQARAELQAGMAAYQSNRQDFQALLASFLDVLKLDQEYWQILAEREMALAQIEQATGVSLR